MFPFEWICYFCEFKVFVLKMWLILQFLCWILKPFFETGINFVASCFMPETEFAL